jgi:hypothetical protein
MNADVDPDSNISVAMEYSNGQPGIPSANSVDFEISSAAGGFWDEAIWDQFVWDGISGSSPSAYIDGVGVNARIVISSTDTYIAPHTIFSYILHYSMRGLNR